MKNKNDKDEKISFVDPEYLTPLFSSPTQKFFRAPGVYQEPGLSESHGEAEIAEHNNPTMVGVDENHETNERLSQWIKSKS